MLEQLTKELEKYGSLDTKTQKKWDALRWGLKDVSDIKMRLIAITTNLNAFSAAITKYVVSPVYSVPGAVEAAFTYLSYRTNIQPPYAGR